MRRVVLAAALLLPVLAPIGSTSRAAEPCAVGLEQRNQWHHVLSVGVLAMDDADPCRLLAVGPGVDTRTSDDGGVTWRKVGTAPTEASRLVTSGLGGSQAVLLGKTGGLWTTVDRGASWQAATGLTGQVRDLVADEQSAGRLYAVVSQSQTLPLPVLLPVGSEAGLYASTDGGRSFEAVVGARALAVTAVVPDAGVPGRLWLGVGGPAGGMFLSDDAGRTFTRAAGGDVTDLASARLLGGGSQVVAATRDGILVSRDAGRTVTPRLVGTAFTEVGLEWEHPSALMLLASTARRSSDTGASARGQAFGLPDGCAPRDLRRDRSVPSVFLVGCADGATWRYRSDGTDLTDTDRLDGQDVTQVPGVSFMKPTPMRLLRRHKLPSAGGVEDGSIAFDGSILYYTDRKQEGTIHRMLASTGAGLPDLRTGVPRGIGHLAYDANRDHLVVLDRALMVWDVDVDTGKAVKLFHAPLSGRTAEEDENSGGQFFYGAMSFDSATDRLLFANDGADGFAEYDREGRERNNCASLGLQNIIILGAGESSGHASIAGLVATGDGLVYVEAEDDRTVVRIDRSCHVLATFQHEYLNEAPNENNALACDTNTFPGTPAVWLRNAPEAYVVAYSVEAGYCALPSAVSVSAPPGVAIGQSGTVCARLLSRAKGQPLAGQPVDLLVAGRGIGSPITDATGRACTAYQPLGREAGLGEASAKTRQPVVAAFLGTPAYRPSTARASLVVSRVVLQPPAPPAPPIAPPHPVPVVVAPPPPPPIQPPPPPPNVPQQQPITQPQGHPGAQPGAMGALGAAPMPEDEVEVAAQTGDVHQMTALNASWEAYALPLLAGLAMGTVAVRRRRESRVRPQF